MPEQIDSLFVRLGLEQDQKEFQQAERSFDSLRSTALQFGAAIGTGFGLNELTFGFAETVNEANKLADVFEGLEVTPQFVSALQGAFRLIDEDASNAESTIRGIADLIEDTDWGQISEQAFARGFDISGIRNAESLAEAMAALNEQFRGIEDTEQARRLAGALGLNDAQFRLMRQTDIGAQMARARELSPLTGEMSQAAADFRQGVNEIQLAFEGIANTFSERFVGELGENMSDIADFMAENRDAIVDFTDQALPYLKGIAGGIGILVALRASRAALGALANVPGAVALTAGIGYGLYESGVFDREEEREKARERVRQQRTQLDRINAMPPGLSFREQQEYLQNNTINVDARGSNNPREIEQASERGVRKALEQAAENTARDMETPVK